MASAVGGAEEGAFVEKNVPAEGESVGFAVGADGPLAGYAGLWLQLFVEADKAVVQLCAAPNEGLVLGKGGVEGGDARRFVVAEYLPLAVVGQVAARHYHRRKGYQDDSTVHAVES